MTTMRLSELARIVNEALASHGDVECRLEVRDYPEAKLLAHALDERPLNTAECIQLKHVKGEPWVVYLSERVEPEAQ